jgi:glutathione peroxidase
MKIFYILIFLILIINSCSQVEKGNKMKFDEENKIEKSTDNKNVSFVDIPFLTMSGDSTSLIKYKGKIALLVNVASKCGFTSQYSKLEELYQSYKDKGLVVIGFPANNFANQEPGTNEEILNFCQTNFGVTFPVMSKISVKGDDKHPLYVYLTEKSSFSGEIKWNFSKFLVDQNGEVVGRFAPQTQPNSKKIINIIESLL